MKYVVLDLETSGLDYKKDRIIGVALGIDGKYTYEPWEDPKVKEKVSNIMKNENITKWGWNLKFDLHFLEEAGIKLEGDFEDGYLMAKLINENVSAGLKNWATLLIDKRAKDSQDEVKSFLRKLGSKNYADVPFEIMEIYAKNDVLYTDKLIQKFFDNPELPVKVYNMEKELLPVVMAMESRGVKMDTTKLLLLDHEMYKESKELEDKIIKEAGCEFNMNSSDQIIKILTERGVKLLVRTKKGKISADKYVLESLEDQLAKLILEYRQLETIRATFCKALVIKCDGYKTLRASFLQMGARTGRFSSASPNLQNIPRGSIIRQAFLCREGYKNLYVDYSQIEMRLLAHYALLVSEGRKKLAEAFIEGGDVHRKIAMDTFNKQDVSEEERRIGKTLNFAVVYGMGGNSLSKKLSRELGREVTLYEAQGFLTKYFKEYPEIQDLRLEVKKAIFKNGSIKTYMGRKRRLASNEHYKALNALIQGTAADIIKLAMIKVYKLLKGTRSTLLQTIHDELIIEIAHGEEKLIPKIKKTMEDFNFKVPIKVDMSITNTNWSEKEGVK